MKKLKLGVLGVSGHFILRILLPLQKSHIIDVYAIASRNEEKAKKAAKNYNIPVYYSSYEDLLSDKNIDFIYNPLPNDLHSDWIKKAADYGKPMICEKPIALNAKEAEDAIKYAKNKNVLISEAFMYKHHPQWKRTKELIKVGEIGTVTSMHTNFNYNNKDPKNIRNIKSAGGGAVMDIGCYAISVSRFILNNEPKRVISLISNDENFNTDILTTAILDFGFVRSTFTVSTQTFPYQRVEIFGTNGNISVQIPFNTFTDVEAEVTITNSVGARKLHTGPVDQYRLEFEEFAQAIVEKKPLHNPPEDAINNMKVIDAVFKSAETGNWVDIK